MLWSEVQHRSYDFKKHYEYEQFVKHSHFFCKGSTDIKWSMHWNSILNYKTSMFLFKYSSGSSNLTWPLFSFNSLGNKRYVVLTARTSCANCQCWCNICADRCNFVETPFYPTDCSGNCLELLCWWQEESPTFNLQNKLHTCPITLNIVYVGIWVCLCGHRLKNYIFNYYRFLIFHKWRFFLHRLNICVSW